MKSDRKVTTIATSQDVEALERDLRSLKRRRVGSIVLDIPDMDRSTQNRLATEINRGYFACGCAEATGLGFVGLIGMGLSVWSRGMLPGEWLASLGYVLIGFASGVVIGKLGGKRLADIRLSRTIAELRTHFGPVQLDPEKPTAACAVHAH